MWGYDPHCELLGFRPAAQRYRSNSARPAGFLEILPHGLSAHLAFDEVESPLTEHPYRSLRLSEVLL